MVKTTDFVSHMYISIVFQVDQIWTPFLLAIVIVYIPNLFSAVI